MTRNGSGSGSATGGGRVSGVDSAEVGAGSKDMSWAELRKQQQSQARPNAGSVSASGEMSWRRSASTPERNEGGVVTALKQVPFCTRVVDSFPDGIVPKPKQRGSVFPC